MNEYRAIDSGIRLRMHSLRAFTSWWLIASQTDKCWFINKYHTGNSLRSASSSMPHWTLYCVRTYVLFLHWRSNHICVFTILKISSFRLERTWADDVWPDVTRYELRGGQAAPGWRRVDTHADKCSFETNVDSVVRSDCRPGRGIRSQNAQPNRDAHNCVKERTSSPGNNIIYQKTTVKIEM